MDVFKNFDSSVEQSLSPLLKQQSLIKGLVHLLLVLYAVRLAPELPASIFKIFENMYFKLFVFALILWTAQFSPSTSILIAVAFLVSTNYINTGKVWEFMENTTTEVPVPQVMAEPMPEMVQVPTTAPSVPAPTPETAVQMLAEAAASPVALQPEQVVSVAQVAVDAMKTDEGVQAVTMLAEAATQSEAKPAQQVMEVTQIAVDSMKKEGCLPRRKVDMAQIMGYGDVDKYSAFKSESA